MKRFYFCLRCLGAALAGSVGFLCAAEKPATPPKVKRGLEVLVTADAISSPEGFRPKPGQPIHYIFSQTRQTLGDATAGVKLPDPALVEQAVVAELARQGFVRTAVGGPMPSIYIMAIVGDSNFEEPSFDLNAPLDDPDFGHYLRQVNYRAVLEKGLFGPGDYARKSLEEIFDPNLAADGDLSRARDMIIAEAMRLRYRGSGRAQDKGKVIALVGGEKVSRAVEAQAISNSEAQRIAWAANENRYYISLNAFDAMRWVKKEKVLLWRTNISIDWRKDLAAELPTMLAHAGPLFGTDVLVPGFLDERSRATANVQIGEAKVVPDAKAQPKAQK